MQKAQSGQNKGTHERGKNFKTREYAKKWREKTRKTRQYQKKWRSENRENY